MIFVPYKADLELNRIPFFTIAISIACLIIFYAQYNNETRVIESVVEYCEATLDQSFKFVLAKSTGSTSEGVCIDLIYKIHRSTDSEARINEIVKYSDRIEVFSEADGKRYMHQLLQEKYRNYADFAPTDLSARLMYEPGSWNPVTMLTSTFAHGSWAHVIGNLFFFFAFSATVEIILGLFWYPVVILALAFGTNVFYSLYASVQSDPLPTLGLSGVVMGVMAMLVFFLPRVKIRFFFWLVLIIWRFGIPAWLVVLWYVGFDTYNLFSQEEMGPINLVAHVTGAALGYGLGVLFFRDKREEVVAEYMEHDPDAKRKTYRRQRRRR